MKVGQSAFVHDIIMKAGKAAFKKKQISMKAEQSEFNSKKYTYMTAGHSAFVS